MIFHHVFTFYPGGMVPKLCKHFTTYQGCKLGSRCRFLHCSQEEYDQMNVDQGGGYHEPGGRNFRGRGRFGGPPPRVYNSRNGEMGGGSYNHPPPPNAAAASYSPPYSSNNEGSPYKGNPQRATYSSPNSSGQPEQGGHTSEQQHAQEREHRSEGSETT